MTSLWFWLAVFIAPVGDEIVLTERRPPDPDEAAFIYDDVKNFIAAYRRIESGADVVLTLERDYFGRATPGLRMFVEKYGLTVQKLAQAIGRHPEKYGGLDAVLEGIQRKEKEIRAAFVELERIVPQTVFPPTYFLVAAHRGIASGSPEGQLISIESMDPDKKTLDTLVVHELVHFQQLLAAGSEKFYALFNEEKTLLGLTIREGAAEFFADRVTGRITQEKARTYVLEREQELWERFQKELSSRETGDWMWQTPQDPDQPHHIAYMIGSRIVGAFYDRAKDKDRAVREILGVTDYPAFLEKSGYVERFGQGQK